MGKGGWRAAQTLRTGDRRLRDGEGAHADEKVAGPV